MMKEPFVHGRPVARVVTFPHITEEVLHHGGPFLAVVDLCPLTVHHRGDIVQVLTLPARPASSEGSLVTLVLQVFEKSHAGSNQLLGESIMGSLASACTDVFSDLLDVCWLPPGP